MSNPTTDITSLIVIGSADARPSARDAGPGFDEQLSIAAGAGNHDKPRRETSAEASADGESTNTGALEADAESDSVVEGQSQDATDEQDSADRGDAGESVDDEASSGLVAVEVPTQVNATEKPLADSVELGIAKSDGESTSTAPAEGDEQENLSATNTTDVDPQPAAAGGEATRTATGEPAESADADGVADGDVDDRVEPVQQGVTLISEQALKNAEKPTQDQASAGPSPAAAKGDALRPAAGSSPDTSETASLPAQEQLTGEGSDRDHRGPAQDANAAATADSDQAAGEPAAKPTQDQAEARPEADIRPGETTRVNEPAAASSDRPADVTPLSRLAAGRLPTGGTEATSDPTSEPRVDATRFVSRVSRAVQTAQQRGGEVQIRLSPPELGSLQIKLSLGDGALTATLEAETATARNLLLDNLPTLRDRLAEQGIRVEKFDVDVQQDGRGGDPSEWQSNERDSRDGAAHEGPEGTAETRAAAAEETTASSSKPTKPNDGAINLVA